MGVTTVTSVSSRSHSRSESSRVFVYSSNNRRVSVNVRAAPFDISAVSHWALQHLVDELNIGYIFVTAVGRRDILRRLGPSYLDVHTTWRQPLPLLYADHGRLFLHSRPRGHKSSHIHRSPLEVVDFSIGKATCLLVQSSW